MVAPLRTTALTSVLLRPTALEHWAALVASGGVLPFCKDETSPQPGSGHTGTDVYCATGGQRRAHGTHTAGETVRATGGFTVAHATIGGIRQQHIQLPQRAGSCTHTPWKEDVASSRARRPGATRS